jgi:hypothetical protein
MHAYDEFAAHLEWVANVDFQPAEDGQRAAIRVLADGVESMMEVRRDAEPAAPGDVEFVAHCISDLRQLLSAATSAESVTPAFLSEVGARIEAASPAPWRACIEADGGLAGCDVILVGSDADNESDLYLWVDGALAASDYFRFVGAARQDVPWLLDALRAREDAMQAPV